MAMVSLVLSFVSHLFFPLCRFSFSHFTFILQTTTVNIVIKPSKQPGTGLGMSKGAPKTLTDTPCPALWMDAAGCITTLAP
jgi:hypothetical protein